MLKTLPCTILYFTSIWNLCLEFFCVTTNRIKSEREITDLSLWEIIDIFLNLKDIMNVFWNQYNLPGSISPTNWCKIQLHWHTCAWYKRCNSVSPAKLCSTLAVRSPRSYAQLLSSTLYDSVVQPIRHSPHVATKAMRLLKNFGLSTFQYFDLTGISTVKTSPVYLPWFWMSKNFAKPKPKLPK